MTTEVSKLTTIVILRASVVIALSTPSVDRATRPSYYTGYAAIENGLGVLIRAVQASYLFNLG
jgi:hypothetical protein